MAKREPARSTGRKGRSLETRRPVARFLIVSEGEKTEKLYFEEFETLDLKVQAIGAGRSSMEVVREAVKQRHSSDLEFTQVWCVFDRDCCTADDFTAAIAAARRNGMRVAYSNEAFELWFLLHFDFHDTAVRRQDYIEKLNGLLGHDYDKNSPTMYRQLAARQPTAIANATKLLTLYERPNPHADNPSTTVHLLVQELNKYRRR